MGEREQAHIALQKSVDLGNEGALLDFVVDHLLHGEDDEAIEVMEKLFTEYDFTLSGLDAISSRLFVESARNPDTGQEYLRQTVATMIEDAPDFWGTQVPYVWYLAFGDLDAFYDYVNEMNDIESSWSNSQQVEYMGRYFKESGYAADPRFIELYKKRWGMFDLWDERGPPDDCSKVDGNWVCE